MDKIVHYRDLIKMLLTQYTELAVRQPQKGVETFLLFDEERDQYMWVKSGWSQKRRIYGVTLHIRLYDEKIWVEQDWTEDGIATDLVNAGVPYEDIVLAFCEPELREMTEFAVA